MTVTREIATPCRRVWEVLSDGWTYSQWVVGNSRMRAVDKDWPAEGSELLHSIGVWPLVVDDKTVVLGCEPERELVLLAKMGPFGAAKVTLRLADSADGCRVQMSEVPAQGLMNVVPDRVAQPALDVRNWECLWRLENLATAPDVSEFLSS